MIKEIFLISLFFLMGLISWDSINQDSDLQDEISVFQNINTFEYTPDLERTTLEYQNYQQLKLLFDSLGYFESDGNQWAVLRTRVKLADLLRQTGNYKYGINFLEKNLTSINEEIPEKLEGQSYNGLAAIYFELFMHQENKAYLDSCQYYAEKTRIIAEQINDYELEVDALTHKGAVLLHQNDYPAAKALLNQAYQISVKHFPDPPLAIMTNLAWAELKTEEYESAMRWTDQCLAAAQKANSLVFIGTSLKIKADIYEANGLHENAAEARDQLKEHQAKDDILFQSLMMKEFVVNHRMNSYRKTMLGLYKEQYYLIRLTFVLVFITIILIIISLGVYKLLYQQKRLREKERELTLLRQKEDALKIENAALELSAKDAEHQALEAKLEVQDQELVYQSLKQIYFSQLTATIKEKFGPFRHKLSRKKDQEQFETVLDEICRDASHDPLSEFEQIFLQMHSGFYEKLLEINPEISRSELQLCALLRMNLPSKEIASLLFLSLSTVDQKRHQIRKKLGLESNQNLNNFLINL